MRKHFIVERVLVTVTSTTSKHFLYFYGFVLLDSNDADIVRLQGNSN